MRTANTERERERKKKKAQTMSNAAAFNDFLVPCVVCLVFFSQRNSVTDLATLSTRSEETEVPSSVGNARFDHPVTGPVEKPGTTVK